MPIGRPRDDDWSGRIARAPMRGSIEPWSDLECAAGSGSSRASRPRARATCPSSADATERDLDRLRDDDVAGAGAAIGDDADDRPRAMTTTWLQRSDGRAMTQATSHPSI